MPKAMTTKKKKTAKKKKIIKSSSKKKTKTKTQTTKPQTKPKPKPRSKKPRCLKCNSAEDLIYSGRHVRDGAEVTLYACANCELEKIKTPIKCVMCDGHLMWVPKAREMFCSYTSCFYTRLFGVQHQCLDSKKKNK
jgi:DNA-directed RNA polymerase subunit M/transcription elongation factor TFIIS